MTETDMSHATLEQWLSHLLAIHPTEIDMGLSRVAQVAEKLGLLDLGETQIITVAGTNGKGTTCAMIESILLRSGKTVGVYSSPHIHEFNERYRINQHNVSNQNIIDSFNAIEAARGDVSLTYFEFATLSALWQFKQAQLDVVLLEVGLGGRLDATNIIDSHATVITSIDIDHQEYLGDTREKVGIEKAGVMRRGCICVIGEPDLPDSAVEHANTVGCQLIKVGHEFNYQRQTQFQRTEARLWQYKDESQSLDDLPIPSLPLPNAATTVALVRQMWPQIGLSTIKQGLAHASLSGRIEQLSEKPLILLDVAHNPHAAKYLAAQLAKYQHKQIHAVCGMLQDKDIDKVLSELSASIDNWLLVTLDNPRGASAKQLMDALPVGITAQQFDTMEHAHQYVRTSIADDDVLIVFGSFFTVAAFHNHYNAA
ncbi:bifunctional tetrahydrofolate synthase/dihydrofolate synthase [Shewanella maritima]|uniref:bifunctional tetrahydrofolate synthase/dihydrofolate synthase n=1 Tax=Shewanella maritima TaxID=2520507 RepID=UPI0037363C34